MSQTAVRNTRGQQYPEGCRFRRDIEFRRRRTAALVSERAFAYSNTGGTHRRRPDALRCAGGINSEARRRRVRASEFPTYERAQARGVAENWSSCMVVPVDLSVAASLTTHRYLPSVGCPSGCDGGIH